MSEFAGRISRPRPERPGVCDATRPATRTPAGIPYWPPLDLNPYLYFDARNNVSTEGGAVSLWYSQWYGGAGPSNGLSAYLDQGTAEWQPIHSTDGYIQFDNVDTRLEYDSPVGQAGVLICATDNGCFAYEVDADSIDEVTALGWETGYFQALKLYAMVLLPATVTDVQIAGAIEYLVLEKGATKNPTGNLTQYWRGRADLVAPKFDALDFSGATNFTRSWYGCTTLTSFPTLDLSAGTTFYAAWRGCTGLTTFPAIPFTDSVTTFGQAWYGCTSMTTFLATGLDENSNNFVSSWAGCTALVTFPAIPLTASTNFNYSWYGCTAMTTFLATGLDSGTNFGYAWYGCTSLATMPAVPLTAGTNFNAAWRSCTSLTSWLVTDVDLGESFYYAWYGCTGLTTFPANVFDGWAPAGGASANCFGEAWGGCTSLTPASVENILNSLASAGVPAPASGVDITIDHAAGTPSVATAVGILKGLSPAWTITLNGTPQ